MLATSERLRESGTTILLWHGAADPQACDGQCDWHAILCSTTDGISAPGPLCDVPLDLDREGERWCPDCLTAIQLRTDSGRG